MCLTRPKKVIKIYGEKALIEGRQGLINIGLVKNHLKKGDFVLVHADLAIKKINKEDALEIDRSINDVGK